MPRPIADLVIMRPELVRKLLSIPMMEDSSSVFSGDETFDDAMKKGRLECRYTLEDLHRLLLESGYFPKRGNIPGFPLIPVEENDLEESDTPPWFKEGELRDLVLMLGRADVPPFIMKEIAINEGSALDVLAIKQKAPKERKRAAQ